MKMRYILRGSLLALALCSALTGCSDDPYEQPFLPHPEAMAHPVYTQDLCTWRIVQGRGEERPDEVRTDARDYFSLYLQCFETDDPYYLDMAAGKMRFAKAGRSMVAGFLAAGRSQDAMDVIYGAIERCPEDSYAKLSLCYAWIALRRVQFYYVELPADGRGWAPPEGLANSDYRLGPQLIPADAGRWGTIRHDVDLTRSLDRELLEADPRFREVYGDLQRLTDLQWQGGLVVVPHPIEDLGADSAN